MTPRPAASSSVRQLARPPLRLATRCAQRRGKIWPPKFSSAGYANLQVERVALMGYMIYLHVRCKISKQTYMFHHASMICVASWCIYTCNSRSMKLRSSVSVQTEQVETLNRSGSTKSKSKWCQDLASAPVSSRGARTGHPALLSSSLRANELPFNTS